MNNSAGFVRTFFLIISIIFMVAFALGRQPDPNPWTYLRGSALGLTIGCLLIGLDLLFKRFNLRAFNIVILGLFIGYLMASSLLLIFGSLLEITAVPSNDVVEIVKIFIFLLGIYLGVTMTLRASDEIHVNIPFIKFAPITQKTKDIVLDLSALNDPRILDLAQSGLLDKRLILPKFLLTDLQRQEAFGDEIIKTRAKRALEVVKKLECMPELHLGYHDTDFPEVKESTNKVLRLARLLDADILSADINHVQTAQLENIRLLNIHSLSKALKPLMLRGEFLKIKIQRYGKEQRQGIGYLEDGTMVVVNGGGNHIGDAIRACVLSVKHTVSGRIIFCNVAENEESKSYDEEDYGSLD